MVVTLKENSYQYCIVTLERDIPPSFRSWKDENPTSSDSPALQSGNTDRQCHQTCSSHLVCSSMHGWFRSRQWWLSMKTVHFHNKSIWRPIPVHNIHQNNQTQLMSFVYQRLKVIRRSKAAARSEKVCYVIPALNVAKSHAYSSSWTKEKLYLREEGTQSWHSRNALEWPLSEQHYSLAFLYGGVHHL